MMNTTYRNQHVFISDDFDILDYDSDALFERYELTPQLPDEDDFHSFLSDHFNRSHEEFITETGAFYDHYGLLSEYWSQQDLAEYSYDEKYEVPMMNSVWYFPQFISFSDTDRLKTVGCITLLFDNELDRWAIAMCGGGMDLTPQLVASFINLEKGVPIQLARAMRVNYPGYVDKDVHVNNCRLVGHALQAYGESIANHGEYLQHQTFGTRD